VRLPLIFSSLAGGIDKCKAKGINGIEPVAALLGHSGLAPYSPQHRGDSMFIGHYGLGYLIKRKYSDIPLWVLFLSVQLMDIVAFILVFLGVEKAAYRDSANPFFRNNLDLPYSHSLVGALLLGVTVYWVLVTAKRKSWGLIAALCVLSHWVIDWAVHTPDLSIAFGDGKVGLGLWSCPFLSFGLEIIFVLAGWFFLGYKNPLSLLLFLLLVASFTGMVLGKEPEAIRNSVLLRTLIVLVPNGVFIILAYFSERLQHKGERPRSRSLKPVEVKPSPVSS
jgi:hypothetical protein